MCHFSPYKPHLSKFEKCTSVLNVGRCCKYENVCKYFEIPTSNSVVNAVQKTSFIISQPGTLKPCDLLLLSILSGTVLPV